MLDIIKEYLVSLGFKVDNNSYHQTQQALQGVQGAVSSFANGSAKNFAIAGAAVVSFVVAANAAIAKFVAGLAKADLENEKLARRLWTTKETAAAYNSTLKAMGATLEDLYLSPELRENFFKLMGQTKDMRPPDEYASQMKFVRSIMFEFQRLKLEVTYAMQWVGYYLGKYLEGPLKKIKGGMQGINEAIIKNMPHWTKNIATVLNWFVRLGITIFRAGKDIIKIFSDIGEKIPASLKIIGVALTTLGLIIRTGPLGMFAAAIAIILLLLEDFYTYLDGGESVFDGLWKSLQGVQEWLSKLWDNLNKSGLIKELGQNVKDLTKNIIDLAAQILNCLDSLAKLVGFDNFGELLEKSIIKALRTLSDVIKTISEEAKALSNLLKGDLGGFIEGDQKATKTLRKAILGDKDPTSWKVSSWDFWSKDYFADLKKSFQDTFSGEWNPFKKEFWTDMWKGYTESADWLESLKKPYVSPNANTKTQIIDASQKPTINVYGSDPVGTSNAVSKQLTDIQVRSFNSAIR